MSEINEIKVVAGSPGMYSFRIGEAQTIESQKNIEIFGTIDGPFIWATKKINQDNTNSHIVYEYSPDPFIRLEIDEREVSGNTSITGRLIQNNDLKKFSINDGFKRTPTELANLLKMNRILFSDRDQSMKLVSNLEKFKIKVEQELEDSKNFQGNKKYLFEQNVKHEIDLSFSLNSSIFQGSDKHRFKVEIMFDVRDKAVEMWLESVELKELQDATFEKLINEQLELFRVNFPEIPLIQTI